MSGTGSRVVRRWCLVYIMTRGAHATMSGNFDILHPGSTNAYEAA
jgi:hypothetical protein